ncbi:MAG: hypothetical protein MJY76_01230 [Bacteroidales bacterium]|nr:hypothetical protein [Bacteroidales bacterium]
MFKKILPYIIAIVAFIVVAYAYTPEVFSGKVVNQSDISSWKGMAQEIVSWNESHPGERALWTNSMFGGMPATTISVIYHGDATQTFYNFLQTGQRPASYLLISMIGAFLLFLAFGVSVPLAAFGAIAVSFCSYNMQIIQVGHNTKMMAIAFMPWVLAAVVHAYRNAPFWGSLFFAFALSFQIKANHPQISYYLAMIILGFAIWQLCGAIKRKAFPRFIKTSVMLLVAGAIGIACNVNQLWPTYEYSAHSMRGGSELTVTPQDKEAVIANANHAASSNHASLTESKEETVTAMDGTGSQSRKGLDLEYATQWSYGIGETLDLMIPNLYGGASAGALTKDSETYKLLVGSGYPPKQAEQIIQALPLYWGPQPFTAGPMYMGALTIFLCILGFFILRGGIRWWVGSVGIIAIFLGWGYHFMSASELFFNYMPMYNKFRTVSMILVILQILIPIMAVLALDKVLYQRNVLESANGNNENLNPTDLKKALLWSLGITGGISLILWLIPSLAGSFSSEADANYPDELAATLAADRMSLLKADALRSLVFILLSATAVWGYTKGWFKRSYALAALIVLVLVDLWTIDKRYLNNEHFVTQKEFTNVLEPRAVDQMILQDTDPDYRVLDLSVNTFNNAYTSYHHKTIGGYSPAKMQRYQDMIDWYILPEISSITNELNGAATVAQAQEQLGWHPVLSMLNTRYLIVGADNPPLVNQYALGNAWYVSKLIPAKTANEEISLLSTINPANMAIVDSNTIAPADLTFEAPAADSTESIADDNATDGSIIALSEYSPNRLVYEFKSETRQPAIFSEIYYAPGWKAYLTMNGSAETDKKELDIFRADYILRGVMVPEGAGKIEFVFEPECFSKGELCSKASSWLLVILLMGAISVTILRRKKN